MSQSHNFVLLSARMGSGCSFTHTCKRYEKKVALGFVLQSPAYTECCCVGGITLVGMHLQPKGRFLWGMGYGKGFSCSCPYYPANNLLNFLPFSGIEDVGTDIVQHKQHFSPPFVAIHGYLERRMGHVCRLQNCQLSCDTCTQERGVVLGLTQGHLNAGGLLLQKSQSPLPSL